MFDVDELVWADFESRAPDVDIESDGTFKYVANPTTAAIILAYAVGTAPARSWHADGAMLDWNEAPDELRAAFDGGATFAAWNTSFDAAVWNYATLGFPFLEAARTIDVMVQAGVSNLPAKLEHASRALGGDGKQADGDDLIKLFCIGGASPADHPEEWQRFITYACRDVEAMREVYRRTRPLPLAEWRQYWAFERINRRGVCIDLPFAQRAAALAEQDAGAIGGRLAELTGGAVTRVTLSARIAAWLHQNLDEAATRALLVVDDEEEEELSLTRDRVSRVLAWLDAKLANGGLTEIETRAHEVAALRLFGAGTSPKKFARLVAQQVDGVLRGQYRFAGAGQTGRASSRGAQIHNLTRDVLGEDGVHEAPLVEAIRNGCDYAALVAASPVDMPTTRKLALIVRPALVAERGKLFLWSDWSMIEARILPWLARAERALDVFRANDRDPSMPDCYVITATEVFHVDARAVTRPQRQVGKVVILACGFSGGVGALKSMAASYRIHLEDAEARRLVDAWRAANPWAVEFWSDLWSAAMSAWETPGAVTTAGRIAFVYRTDYLGGTLFMSIPSGRLLTYPQPRWRNVDVLDEKGKPTGEKRREMSFRRAYGRVKLWRGLLCENAVSGTAADILRETVTRIETDPALAFMPIRMTTHDEIVCEVDAARAEEAKIILRREMLTLPEWAAGLPLQSEENVRTRYTKSKVAWRRG
jgi:DNA polymerase